MFKKFILLVAMLFVTTPAFAIGSVQKGEKLPEIKLYDQHGGERQFGNLVGKNGMILVFYRSADWCPFCKAQLIDLRDNKEKFEKEGYSLVGVSYDSLEVLKKFEMQHAPGFALLSDPASKTIREFGLFNNDYAKGTFAYGVPHPAVYVVGKDKKVHAVLSEKSYKERPQVDSIMKVIEDVKPKPKVVVDDTLREEGKAIMEEAKHASPDEPVEVMEPSPLIEQEAEEAAVETIEEDVEEAMEDEAIIVEPSDPFEPEKTQ